MFLTASLILLASNFSHSYSFLPKLFKTRGWLPRIPRPLKTLWQPSIIMVAACVSQVFGAECIYAHGVMEEGLCNASVSRTNPCVKVICDRNVAHPSCVLVCGIVAWSGDNVVWNGLKLSTNKRIEFKYQVCKAAAVQLLERWWLTHSQNRETSRKWPSNNINFERCRT